MANLTWSSRAPSFPICSCTIRPSIRKCGASICMTRASAFVSRKTSSRSTKSSIGGSTASLRFLCALRRAGGSDSVGARRHRAQDHIFGTEFKYKASGEIEAWCAPRPATEKSRVLEQLIEELGVPADHVVYVVTAARIHVMLQ